MIDDTVCIGQSLWPCLSLPVSRGTRSLFHLYHPITYRLGGEGQTDPPEGALHNQHEQMKTNHFMLPLAVDTTLLLLTGQTFDRVLQQSCGFVP